LKVGFVSLGCAKNLVDTEVMLGIMQARGIELTANPAEADILIVNTCAFILSAKEESITTILNLAEYKNGRCRALIVAGCLGQIYKRELLEEMPEVADDKPDADALSGAIEISHLTFSYTDDSPNVVDDMSFRIAAGENVAIVGKSGCGKSTLLRLLLGFEKPKSGAIYYDGQDLSELNVSSVRSQMGVVLQNGQLMSGDIFTNIVGTTALTQDDAWEAAKAAGLDEDIKKMPMGMQTVISEGSSNISGGQRQRILIARALAAKPAILIFDEATSALDNRTQAIVTESLNKRNVTRIVVAHRLSTIFAADKIFVIDKGKICESGTHKELLALNGVYSNLYNIQFSKL